MNFIYLINYLILFLDIQRYEKIFKYNLKSKYEIYKKLNLII